VINFRFRFDFFFPNFQKAEENKAKKFTIDFGGRMILAENNSDSFAKEVTSGLEQSKDQPSS
jgi:hypothetical protein